MNKLGTFKSQDLVEDFRKHAMEVMADKSPADWAKDLINSEYDEYYFDDKNILLEDTVLPKVPSSVNGKFATDIDLAITLYENLELEPLTANDGRLWTYLSLGMYRDYIYNRYDCLHNNRVETILGYFFFKGSAANALASNPISKLWWGIHKTIDKDLDDPYRYSRILFSKSQVFFDVIERAAIISNRDLTRSFLEIIEKNPKNPTGVSENLSPMILNHLGNHSIDILNKSELDELLEKFVTYLKSQKKI